MHWHSTSDEWQCYLSGQGRMTVFASGGKARTFDYRAGDVGYVPFGGDGDREPRTEEAGRVGVSLRSQA